MDIKKLVKRVSTYFLIAVVLKISLSVASLLVSDPKWFGFILPITVMLSYWAAGYFIRERWDTQLTLAKFADSVYYLGFLFTVGSIIICLLDINSIGDSLNGMATRFGAAMVSTGLGMLARVMHSGFRVDANDAIRSVEERAINAAENLTISFDNTFQQLEVFRDKVSTASREAVQSVQEQVKALYAYNISATDVYFANATKQSNEAFALILENTKQASDDLLATITELKAQSAVTLRQMEDNALDFGNMARDRLEQTIFPDDLFTRKLGGSIDTLAGTTDNVNEGIVALADDVKTATRQVSTAIRGLTTKTQMLEENLAAAGAIVSSQERLVEAMQTQSQGVMDRVERVQKEFLNTIAHHQDGYLTEAKTHHQVVERIVDKLDALHLHLESNDIAERLSGHITSALNTVRDTGEKTSDVMAKGLQTTLAPLVQVLHESNETHRALAARLEQSNRSLDMAHSQLDGLMSRIDHISSVDVTMPAQNEEAISAETLGSNASADVRPA